MLGIVCGRWKWPFDDWRMTEDRDDQTEAWKSGVRLSNYYHECSAVVERAHKGRRFVLQSSVNCNWQLRLGELVCRLKRRSIFNRLLSRRIIASEAFKWAAARRDISCRRSIICRTSWCFYQRYRVFPRQASAPCAVRLSACCTHEACRS